MGLDGQVGVKTRELENVFFFHFKDHYLFFFFSGDTTNLHCSVLQACSAGREGKYQRESGP